ncbi:extracellular solute-binding protein [Paenibacillus sp. Leaf72]|uniref:extracellular solute-binding protein n=1 Tax=Paenibacillus sp. Leaf72 TaxID=1736234 RepID=UPI0006F9DB42|nr:extracellular solute-binding protein [Paenibacillus sp. Leaf72]KQO17601.1 ABC transporter substrate-binding protein [Paenibacillus sp. Leaf72]
MNKVKLLLTALLSVQLLASCDYSSGTNKEVSSEFEGETAYQGAALSQYNPAIELTFARESDDSLENLISQLPEETFEDNRWNRLYEQMLGIKIKYDWVAKGDLYHQKLSGAFASGDIPDVVRVNAQQLRMLSNAGLIQDLSAAYEQYASSFTKKILSQEGTGPFEAATVDGRLMGIPETSSSIEGAMFIWLRTDWLEQVGLKPPKTMGDVLAISKAFTENDPDNNGINDTFGLAVTQYLFDPVMGLAGFMAGYEAYPNLWIKDKSGKLLYGGIQPEVKEALKVLQNTYRDGQIDSEFGLKDGLKEEKLIAESHIGMFYGEQWGSLLAQTSRAAQPNAEWQAFPIVSVSGEEPMVPLRFSTSQFLAVRKAYPHPEAIVKLFNLHLEKNWGETAEYETYYSSPLPVWKLSPVTPFPAMKNLEAYRQIAESERTGDHSVLKDEASSIYKNIQTYRTGHVNKESGWGWERTYGPNGAFAILDQYMKNNQLLYESFVGPPTETMIVKQAILYNQQIETFVNIILGSPIDEFDRFVDDWNKLGGSRITAEVNQWYAERGSDFK